MFKTVKKNRLATNLWQVGYGTFSVAFSGNLLMFFIFHNKWWIHIADGLLNNYECSTYIVFEHHNYYFFVASKIIDHT